MKYEIRSFEKLIEVSEINARGESVQLVVIRLAGDGWWYVTDICNDRMRSGDWSYKTDHVDYATLPKRGRSGRKLLLKVIESLPLGAAQPAAGEGVSSD